MQSGIPHSTFHIPHSPFPARPIDRTRWITDRRGPKNAVDPARAYAALHEEEPDTAGDLIPTATIFLTNRECPYRCLMCDLWQNTLDETVPLGAIPSQIRRALADLPPTRQVKLYNAGSFFDPKQIPVEDYPAIADLMSPYDRVIVECHPKLIDAGTTRFRDLLFKVPCFGSEKHADAESALGRSVRSPQDGGLGSRRLEIAIGLETVHEGVLDKLNKRFTLADFRRAADFLRAADIDLRVFLLLKPPFLTEREAVDWAKRSLDFAFECGATVCCVIPTRDGNGAMEALRESGEWSPPSIASLMEVQEYGLSLGRGRVFADLWDIERFYNNDEDADRHRRIAEMNRTQSIGRPTTNPIVAQASLPVS